MEGSSRNDSSSGIMAHARARVHISHTRIRTHTRTHEFWKRTDLFEQKINLKWRHTHKRKGVCPFWGGMGRRGSTVTTDLYVSPNRRRIDCEHSVEYPNIADSPSPKPRVVPDVRIEPLQSLFARTNCLVWRQNKFTFTCRRMCLNSGH